MFSEQELCTMKCKRQNVMCVENLLSMNVNISNSACLMNMTLI